MSNCVHPARILTDRPIGAHEAFCIYRSIKLEVGGYNVTKYGYYADRIIKQWEKESSKLMYKMFAEKYNTEARAATCAIANLVVSPTRYLTDIDHECYTKLRKWNTNPAYYAKEEATKLLETGKTFDDLFRKGEIITMATSGDISPELFCTLYRTEKRIPELLDASEQSYIWNIIKPRLVAYKNYVR